MELTSFDRIELLTVHSYDNAILEKKDEQSMKNVRLVGIKEQQLHSMQDYINALKIILESSNNTHLNERVKLAKKPKPWRINLLLELAYSGWIKIRTIKNRFGSICKDIEYQMVLDLLDNLIPATLDLYQNLNRSHALDTKGKRKKNPTTYYLATLDQQVDIKNLPMGYHTGHPPKPNVCDACDTILNNVSDILICGHGYHRTCYNNLRNRCNHCEQYYKRENDENVDEEQEEGIEETDDYDLTTISFKLTTALLNVEQW
ncbi:hypothetical protein C1646_776574 [Rhizophagus diaphanus]|nr:hypothetical protein C1646_776574 [Rhizophagus diaphanus] [Rhizophagus sp. MUCL 43196]